VSRIKDINAGMHAKVGAGALFYSVSSNNKVQYEGERAEQ